MTQRTRLEGRALSGASYSGRTDLRRDSGSSDVALLRAALSLCGLFRLVILRLFSLVPPCVSRVCCGEVKSGVARVFSLRFLHVCLGEGEGGCQSLQFERCVRNEMSCASFRDPVGRRVSRRAGHATARREPHAEREEGSEEICDMNRAARLSSCARA